ncbi:hypothetical protein BGZ49_003890, partial [Haplosporangium sp. Z 27]
MDIIGIQETKLTTTSAKGLFWNDGNKATDKDEYYVTYWAHGNKQVDGLRTSHLGAGVGLLVNKYWATHIIRRVTYGGRVISVDFSFRTGFRLRVINCYIPSDTVVYRDDIPRIEKWVEKECREAQQDDMCVILMGDFNGTTNPQLDRARDNSRSNAETALLRWIGTQPLFDTFRFVHPTTRSYTFQDTSRIDMIFTNHRIALRVLKVSHKDMPDSIQSDHRMVSVSIALDGQEHLTDYTPCPPKKATGFRFQFRDATAEQWEDFTKTLTVALDDRNAISQLGLNYPGDISTGSPKSLADVDLNQVWQWYSKAVTNSAKATIPGKTVGRSGVKPASEMSIRHIIRSCSKLKRLAKDVRLTLSHVEVGLWNKLQDYDERLRSSIDKFNAINQESLPPLAPTPPTTETAMTWTAWVEEIKMYWDGAIKMLMAERAA